MVKGLEDTVICDRKKEIVNRRDFLKMIGATVCCACAGAIGLNACSTWRESYYAPLVNEASYHWQGDRVLISLSAANGLYAAGNAVRLELVHGQSTEEKIIVLRPGEDNFQAFADRCTHNEKELYYIPEENMLRCYSGKSHFDLEGHVIKGPADGLLRSYPIRRVGDELIIELEG